MLNRLFYTLFWVILGMGVKAQEGNGGIIFLDSEKWEKVLKLAQEQDRLIFMDCYTSWCGPCKALSKEIFTQEEVGDFFNTHFVNVKYDMEKGEGKAVKTFYAAYIAAYPTLLLIDKKGKVVQQLVGYQEAEQLLKGVKDGMEGRSVFNYRQMYESGKRDVSFLKDYVNALENALLQDEARKVAVDFMDSIPLERLKEKEVWGLVGSYVDDPYTPQFEFVLYNLGHYWFKLGLDRYKLELQMRQAITGAIEYIVGKNWDENKQVLPLTNEPEKVERLRRFLARESFPQAEALRTKLRIHELKLEKRWADVFTYLTVCRDAGVLLCADYYINESIEYLAQNATDPALLTQCLALMEELQANGDRVKAKLFKTNFYGTLTLLHEKLNHEKEAAECRAECEKRHQEAKATYERVTKHE